MLLLISLDFLHKSSYKEEFEGDTSSRTAAYIDICEDSSTGLTYKLPLEVIYAGSLNLISQYNVQP
nr:palindromic element RPE1 domain-containing protein [Rickettsia asembonensis]